MDDQAIEKYMVKAFAESWKKYDVNKDNFIMASLMPGFFKSLVGDNATVFDLSEEEKFKGQFR